MLKTKKLMKLKNQIIDKLITVESLEKTKNKEMLKGGFFKQCLKYTFLKPLCSNKICSNEDKFFIDNEGSNCLKVISLIMLIALGFTGALISLIAQSFMPILLFFSASLILTHILMIVSSVFWLSENNKTKKKFDVKNIENIKENLLENYSDFQVKNLLSERLDKKELTNIMKSLEKLIGKDEIVRCFEKIRKANASEKIFNDISEPYVLIKLIERLILNEKGKEEIQKEKEIKEFNNNMIDSLINENKEETENYNEKELIGCVEN